MMKRVSLQVKGKEFKVDIEQFRTDFLVLEPRAKRLLVALTKEIGELLNANDLALGVPLEGRVKAWVSIQDKLDRKSLELRAPSDLDDLVGVRVILLFRVDLENVIQLLNETFNVLSVEDTASRLGDSQFGYQSRHLILRLPAAWAGITSLSDLCELKAEIQVRTVAQHIWAAASHKLQYKQEESVPPPLRRTIYRISALLETVDLELDRVLEERRQYTDRDASITSAAETLNVDLLAKVLDAALPALNKSNENYEELLQDLLHFGVNTPETLRHLLSKHIAKVMDVEQQNVERTTGGDCIGTTKERVERGVYFTHGGLVRNALGNEFGDAPMKALWNLKVKRPEVQRELAKRKRPT